MSYTLQRIPQVITKEAIRETPSRKPALTLRAKVIRSWLCFGLIVSIPCVTGVWAFKHLADLPENPNCLGEISPIASRLYCAQTISSDEHNPDQLVKAIALANSVPTDHPLRTESDRLVEKCSQKLLTLAEKAFQDGNLDRAINILEQIPANLPTRQVANNKIKQWQIIWSKAENIYKAASNQLSLDANQGKWYKVLTKAKELLHVGNDYWATTKYSELVDLIQNNREAEEGFMYEQEKDISQASKSNLDSLTVKSTFVPKIKLQQEQETKDRNQLTKASTLASSGQIEDLREAIAQAYQVTSPRYNKEAQKLIDTWNRQLETALDRSTLARAQQTASNDDIVSLEIAIAEAQLIPKRHNLYKEANKYVEKWNQRILQIQKTQANLQQLDVNSDPELTILQPEQIVLDSTSLVEGQNITSDRTSDDVEVETLHVRSH